MKVLSGNITVSLAICSATFFLKTINIFKSRYWRKTTLFRLLQTKTLTGGGMEELIEFPLDVSNPSFSGFLW